MPSIVRKLTQFTKKEIDLLFQQARRILKHPALTLLIAPQQKDFGRILIIASKKVGTAPERNKLRRQIKSIFYENKLFEYPFDCVVILNKHAVSLSFEDIKELIIDAYHEVVKKDESTAT